MHFDISSVAHRTMVTHYGYVQVESVGISLAVPDTAITESGYWSKSRPYGGR